MKQTCNLFLVALFFILFTTISTADQEVKSQQIFLGKQKTFKLTGQKPFIGTYQLSINQNQVPKNQQKWYLFIMAEPKQKSTQLLGKPSTITIKSGGKKLKECQIVQQSDSCFIKNNQFDYKKQKLTITVECDSECEYHLMSEVDYAYPLKLNKAFKLDFQNTAYSKLFTLNLTDAESFYELRIMIQPRGFISYGEPIILLANYGNQVPTQSKHDFKGIHTWDDGQGIFIRKSQMKESVLTILVEGPEKNVVDLAAYGYQKQQKLELVQYMPEFDWLKAGETRSIVFAIEQKKFSHRVKVIVFTGYLQLPQLFKVEQGIVQKVTPLKYSIPNQRYGEYQFRISKQMIEKENLKKVLLKMSARKQTTYVVNYARQQQAISTILPYVSESSVMQPGQVDQYFIKVEQLIELSKTKKSSTIEIIVGNLFGNVKPTFYQCGQKLKGELGLKKCEITQNNKNQFKEIIPSKKQNRGGEQRYWFDIQWDSYAKKADKDAAQVVFQMVILVENINTEGKTSSYEIQYKNKDRIYLLKEGELIKDRVFINEKRHYKLSLPDNDATEVRIHCTRISGEAFFIGSFEDPRVNKSREKILALYGVITFKIDEDKKVNQVFLEVQGVDNAYFSLTTQVIRRSQANPTKKNATGYNQLIVRQQIPYEFLIAPLDSIVLQLHSTTKKVNLNLKATSTVKLCMTQNLQAPPFAPNCDVQNDFFIDMAQQIVFDKGLIGNIGIKNTNTDKNVSIKIKFSNKEKASNNTEEHSDNDTCQLASMNDVMVERLGPNGADRENKSFHCLEFNLHKYEEVELIVDVRGEHHYEQGSIVASINGQETIRILSPSHIFSKQQVETSCLSAKPSGEKQNFCYLKVKIQGITNVRIRVVAQYTNDAIRLIDGVAHSVHAQITKSESKYFYMAIHNIENITVLLQNKLGEYKLYANLLPFSEFSQKHDKSAYPTKTQKDVESSNPFYYLQQTLIIPKAKIAEKCPATKRNSTFIFGRKWVDCILLISVVLDGQIEIIKGGKFVIEATQQNRELVENDPYSGFLQKKSVAFFYFQNNVPNSTVLVDINNQNKNCIDIYVRKGSERATAQYNQKHAKASNTLMYSDAEIGVYSITLEANQNCPYTISASSAKNKISRIKKGSFSDIKLALNEQANFIFENLINETFKVQTLHKSGQVIISVLPIPKEELKETLKKNFSEIHDWVWSNKDSVRINNMISKAKQPNPKFCVNCYYLININAQRPTEASIVIPTPGAELPVTTDSTLKDLLEQDQSATYRVFTDKNSQFQVYVQYGKIQITIVQSDKEIVAFNQTFQSTKAPVIRTFNLSKTQQYDYLRYIKVNIRALEGSYYSFTVLTTADPNQRGMGLKYGLPQYVYLDASKQKCLNGTMTASVDQFLLSFSKTDLKTATDAQIKIKVNGKQLSYDKQVGSNEMLLRINSMLGAEANQSKSFDICMKSKTPVAVTVIQSSPLNYWPQKEPIIVKGQNNLTFGAEGKTIIELNECFSRANAEIFSEFNSMKSTTSEIKQRRKNNNIIEFYHYGPVYIKAQSEKATMRWLNVDEGEKIGLGYDQYKSSSIRVIKLGDVIEVNAEPILPISPNQVKSKLVSVKYLFYAAREQMELYNAMNCGQGQFVTSEVKVDLQKNPEKASFVARTSFNINNELKTKFQQQNYFLMGVKAEVTVKNTKNEIQNYRFFYPYQQVSRQTLIYGKQKPNIPDTDRDREREIDNGQQQEIGQSIFSFIGYALVALIVIVAAYFVYTKYCKKCMKRQKNVEDLGKEMKYFDLSQNH